MRSPVLRVLLLTLSLAAVGCTLGVSPVEVSADAEHDAEGITLVAGDFRGLGTRVDVRGAARSTLGARLVARGLVRPGDEEAAQESLAVDFLTGTTARGEAGIAVSMRARGRFTELMRLHSAELDVPTGTDIDLRLGDSSASLVDVGTVMADLGSGSIDVTHAAEVELRAGSGSIVALDVGEAILSAGSGSIHVELREGIDAETGSGSISGFVGDGGRAQAGSGSVTLRATRALVRDLVLSAGSGSVSLDLLAGATDVELDLDAGSGSIHVEAGGVTRDGEGPIRVVLGSGGPRIEVRTGSGSISIGEWTPE